MRRVTGPTWVYFLRPVGADGPVKIGSSTLPEARLLAYVKISPYPLEIVAKIEGDRVLESRFHNLLSAHLSHHEWFFGTPEVRAVTEAVRAGTFDIDALPEPKRLCPERHRWSPQVKLGVRLLGAVDRIERAGVAVPGEVVLAARRYAGWAQSERTVDDGAQVMRFVERHPRHLAKSTFALAAACGVWAEAA